MRRLLSLVCLVAALLPAPAQATVAERQPTGTGHAVATDPPRPALSGWRMRIPGTDGVYLIDPEGYRRGIPNWSTHENLFRDLNAVEPNSVLAFIPVRSDLSRGAHLARVDGTDGVYLISNGIRRGIASPATMDKYGFDWAKVRPIEADVLESIPDGPTWR